MTNVMLLVKALFFNNCYIYIGKNEENISEYVFVIWSFTIFHILDE